MGHNQHSSIELINCIAQSINRLNISTPHYISLFLQVIRWLIKYQNVRLTQRDLSKCYSTLLTS